MTRFAHTGTDAEGNPVLRPFTAEEEAARDADEAIAATAAAADAAKTPDDRAVETLGKSRELRVMVRALVALTGKTIAECRAAIIAAIKAET